MVRITVLLNSYLRMGYLLHLVTIVEVSVLIFLFYQWEENWSLVRVFIYICLCSSPLLAQLDARSRFQNYKLVKDQLCRFGFQERIVKPFIKSRCQRDAALRACVELGIGAPCMLFFGKYGYRWYHLFPDIILKNPSVIFNKTFLKTTFFVKTYRPRFNLNKSEWNGESMALSTLITHPAFRKNGGKASV